MDRQKYINTALNEVVQQVQDLGYTIIYACVQGSTNYNLDIYTSAYTSDIDVKCFILPSLEDLYYERKISKTYTTKYGLVEVKDIRLLPDLLGKMNLTYLELLCSEFYWSANVRFSLKLRSYRDALVKERVALLVKTMYGMTKQKADGLFHPFEGKAEILAKFGYDPKQMHHAWRMLFMAQRLFIDHMDLASAYQFTGDLRDLLLDIKVNGAGTPEMVKEQMAEVVVQMKSCVDLFWTNKAPRNEYAVKSDTYNTIKDLVHDYVMKQLTK